MPLHTVSAYEQDLRALNAQLEEMGRLASVQLHRALTCLADVHAADAEQVIADDHEIDALERAIDAQVVRLLALRQPMAVDLRQILMALRLAIELERIGDLAAGIAKRALSLSQFAPVPPAASVPVLGRQVQDSLDRVLTALSRRDLEAAEQVWRNDQQIDDRYTALFRETLTYMMEDPRTIGPCSHLLFIAKNLERIGDHATNIAEGLRYLITGQEETAERPRGAAASAVIVRPT